MNMVEVVNLKKKYGDRTVVDNLTFTVKKGERFGLLGPNGAGKSTVISCISGLLRYSSGQIKVDGLDLYKNGVAVKEKIGLVPQELAIYENLTALENVIFFAGLYGISSKLLKEQAMEALAFTGLSEQVKVYPKTFSGGMKRRLNIACSIAHNPEIIILDEPTVGIDPQSRNHILDSIKKLNERGSTIIYTSHYMEEVEALCNNIAILDQGKLLALGTKEELDNLVSDISTLKISFVDTQKMDLSKITENFDITTAELLDKTLVLSGKNDKLDINGILENLLKTGLIIKNIETCKPNLETVFLNLTGRKLRDIEEG